MERTGKGRESWNGWAVASCRLVLGFSMWASCGGSRARSVGRRGPLSSLYKKQRPLTVRLPTSCYCASVQRTIHDRDELVGPRPALPMPQGALRRQDMQALGSPTVDLRGELIYRGLSSDRAGRLRSIRTSKFSSKSIFLLCGKCAICDFPSETSATPLPPFRNALRLEKKNCELMRCSLTR